MGLRLILRAMAWLPSLTSARADALHLGCRHRNGHEVRSPSPCYGLGRGISRRGLVSVERPKGVDRMHVSMLAPAVLSRSPSCLCGCWELVYGLTFRRVYWVHCGSFLNMSCDDGLEVPGFVEVASSI